MKRTIDSRQAGMGDAVVGLWIAEGARERGDEILFVDSVHSDVVRAFGHQTTPEPSEECMGLGLGTDTYNDEFHSKLMVGASRILQWQRTMGWDYEPRRPVLSSLGAEANEWSEGMRADGPFVVLAPRANVASRSMPTQKWLRIAWSLQQAGVRTIAIDGQKNVVEAFPTFVFGFGWQHILALIKRSATVAGNDSGIAHLSATMGVPTVVAMGPTDPHVVFGHCSENVSLVRAEAIACVGCHFFGDKGYQLACDHGCEALETLDWRKVRDAILVEYHANLGQLCA